MAGLAAVRPFRDMVPAGNLSPPGVVSYGLPPTPLIVRRAPVGIIGTLIIGLIAGAVAKLLMPGRDPGGFIITMLLGVAGAFVATYLGQAVGWYEAGEGAGFIGAVVGAVLLLLTYRAIGNPGQRRG